MTVASLERELGFEMFERSRRGVRPTPFAHAFYEKAVPVLKAFSECEALRCTVSLTKGERGGQAPSCDQT